MATNRIDYYMVLNRAGYLRCGAGDLSWQTWLSARDIIGNYEYNKKWIVFSTWQRLKQSIEMNNIETYEDYFTLILTMLDHQGYMMDRYYDEYIETLQPPSISNYKWVQFMGEYGLKERKDMTILELFISIDSFRGKRILLKGFKKDREMSMTERSNIEKAYYKSLFYKFGSIGNLRRCHRAMKIVLKHKSKNRYLWSWMTEHLPMEYIVKNAKMPWSQGYLIARRDLTDYVIAQMPQLTSHAQRIQHNYWRFSPNWLQINITPQHYISQLKSEFSLRKWTGVWQYAPYLGLTKETCRPFQMHAAAGVVQRIWRRHRERRRRKTFIIQCTDTRLSKIPLDVRLLIYRFIRPIAVLRGLPPKYH